MQVLAGYVLVRPDDEPEKSEGGIIISNAPESLQKRCLTGVVISRGKDKDPEELERRIKVDVKVGDKILYGKFSGVKVFIDRGADPTETQKPHLVLGMQELLGKIHE